MKLKKAVILKAFTRWGRAYTIGETVEDRVDKIGVLVHERKARLVKPEQGVKASTQQPTALKAPQPLPAPKTSIPEPSPAPVNPEPSPAAESVQAQPSQVVEPTTVADAQAAVESHKETDLPDGVTGLRHTRKGKSKP